MTPNYNPYNPYGFGLDSMQDKPDEDMTPEEHDALRLHAAVCGCATFLLVFIVGLLLCLLLGSCTTTKVVTVERVRTDTTYITQQQRDSIWLHDSIYMKEWLHGDTIYQLRDRWHTKYIEKLRVDTFLRLKTDSVPVPYPVEKRVEVEKPLTWWQSVRLSFANVMLIGLGIFIAIKVWQYRKKFLP